MLKQMLGQQTQHCQMSLSQPQAKLLRCCLRCLVALLLLCQQLLLLGQLLPLPLQQQSPLAMPVQCQTAVMQQATALLHRLVHLLLPHHRSNRCCCCASCPLLRLLLAAVAVRGFSEAPAAPPLHLLMML
jgi:hypothetical protein